MIETVISSIIRAIAEELEIAVPDTRIGVGRSSMSVRKYKRHEFYFFHNTNHITLSHNLDTHYSDFPLHMFTISEDEGEIIFATHGTGTVGTNILEVKFTINLHDPAWLENLARKFWTFLFSALKNINETGPRDDK